MKKFNGLTKFIIACCCAAVFVPVRGQEIVQGQVVDTEAVPEEIVEINDVELSDALSPEIVEGYLEEEMVRGLLKGVLPHDYIETVILGNDPSEIEIDIELGDGVTEEEAQAALEQLQSELTDYARKFLGTRYKWGAKGPNAFDCSGFTGYVFRNFGYDIGPCSRVQATRGEKIDIKDARVGDLMFFSRPKGGKTVGHVGMVIDVNPETGELKFIHASTKKGVTIQNFPDSGHYNRRFLQVRRVIDENALVSKA